MSVRATSLQRQNGLWREMLDGWLAVLTQPSRETLLTQKEQADSLKTVLGIGLLGLVVGLWAIVAQPAGLVLGRESDVVDLIRIIFFAEADFFIISMILFFIAKIYGGEGDFIQHSYLLSVVAVPLGMIVVALLFVSDSVGLTLNAILNPLSPVGIAGILIVLFGFYGLLLLLFALQAAHEVSASAVAYTLGTAVGGWGVLRIVAMFFANEENIITIEWFFIYDQWAKGSLQAPFWGHFWLVVFSVAIAIVIGVTIGVFITMPPRRLAVSHWVVLVPFALFFLLWAASSGMFGAALADQVLDTATGLSRNLRGGEGFLAPLLGIIAAIIRKPVAVGVIGMGLVVILYALFLAGETASELSLYIAGIILTIPSIALFGVLIAPLGIGAFNAVFALVLYAQLPILRNTYTGIREVAPEVVEAGRGMGMSEFQLLREIKLPIAVPVIMTGVRVSIVMMVGITAIAAYIGNDTLGDYIFAGIQRAQEKRYIAGAAMVAVLALVVDYFLDWLQERLTPEGLKGRRQT